MSTSEKENTDNTMKVEDQNLVTKKNNNIVEIEGQTQKINEKETATIIVDKTFLKNIENILNYIKKYKLSNNMIRHIKKKLPIKTSFLNNFLIPKKIKLK